MRSPVDRWRYCGTKSEGRDLFVGVIVLKDFTDRLDSLQVLVLFVVEVVKRVPVIWMAIAQSEVDCNAQLDLTTTEYVFEERVPCMEV